MRSFRNERRRTRPANYGHRPLREFVFGGVTQALIENAKLPVFMLH
jgi:nucleotide-binding universal stress UspA family protein